MEKFHNYNEGPKPIMVDLEFSEAPDDSFFGQVLGDMKSENSPLTHLLEEINRSPGKKKIITEELIMKGLDWLNLKAKKDDSEAIRAIGHLLAHWDTPIDGKPKTPEQHRLEAEEFANKLK